jgi:hypothetical protein
LLAVFRGVEKPDRDENPAIIHQQNDHNYHAMDHVLSTLLPSENRLYGSLNPEDLTPKTEINPRKARNSGGVLI